ncbi:MAG: hypothetical protein ACYTFI_20130 [Planctomycetota bacterium]|jgi:hypothetical protein
MRLEPTGGTLLAGAAAVAVLVLPAGEALARQAGWRQHWRRTMRGAFDPGAMAEKAGKLYVVCEATLARVDLKEFTVEERADLSGLGRDEEETKKERAKWIALVDENKDKVIDALDGARWNWARGNDHNKDGKVTPDEADIGPAPGAAGVATLQIVKGDLVMLRSGYVFKFDPKTLELEATERILPPEPEPEEEDEPKKDEKKKATEGTTTPEKKEPKPAEEPAVF